METVVTSAPIKFGTQTRLFHELLCEERKRRNLKPATLAKWALVSEEEYRKWEMGVGLPTLDQMSKMFGNNQPLLNVLRAAHQAQALLRGPEEQQRSANVDSAAAIIQGANEIKKDEEGKVEESVTSPSPTSPSPPTPPAPPISTPETKFSFGTALRHCRDSAGQSQYDVGLKLGVTPGMVGHWEHERSTPSKVQYDLLCALFPLLPSLHQPLTFANAPTTKSEFGSAFRAARAESGLSVEEIAKRLNVGLTTVYVWARGGAFPNEQVYDKLVDLLPALKALPRPANLAPPPTNALSRAAEATDASSSEVNVVLEVETQTPTHSATPASTPDVLATLDVAVAAFAEIGVDLTPKFEREATGGWKVEISDQSTFKVYASGAGMPEATKNALIELSPALTAQEESIQRGIAALQAELATIQKASAMVRALEG